MSSRQEELANLKVYLNEVDKDITMILQNLQWDRTQLTQVKKKSTCKYNYHHKIPTDKMEKHEEICFLKCNGYSETDRMLSEPLNYNLNGLVKFSSENIQEILDTAAQQDPLFIRGPGCKGPEPLTLERLQATYTADERRAIYDAVVNTTPSSHDLSELALPSVKSGESSTAKSRLEILAELRDMKRRRTKYRVAARTSNYSDALRSVIKTQMELYSESLAKPNNTSSYEKSDDLTQFKTIFNRDKTLGRLEEGRKYEDEQREYSKQPHLKQHTYDKYEHRRDRNSKKETVDKGNSNYDRIHKNDKYNESKDSLNKSDRDSAVSRHRRAGAKYERDSYRSRQIQHDSGGKKYQRDGSFIEEEKRSSSKTTYENQKRDLYKRDNRESYKSSRGQKSSREEKDGNHKERRSKYDRDGNRFSHTEGSRSGSCELGAKHRKH